MSSFWIIHAYIFTLESERALRLFACSKAVAAYTRSGFLNESLAVLEQVHVAPRGLGVALVFKAWSSRHLSSFLDENSLGRSLGSCGF